MKRLALMPLRFMGGCAIAIGLLLGIFGLFIMGYVEDVLDEDARRQQARPHSQASPKEALV